MPQTPCFQECFSSAGAFRCCCSVLEKCQPEGLLQKTVIKVPGSPGKPGECQAATPEVMNLFFYILICLANLHPGVWKELAEEQFFLNVVL